MFDHVKMRKWIYTYTYIVSNVKDIIVNCLLSFNLTLHLSVGRISELPLVIKFD